MKTPLVCINLQITNLKTGVYNILHRQPDVYILPLFPKQGIPGGHNPYVRIYRHMWKDEMKSFLLSTAAQC